MGETRVFLQSTWSLHVIWGLDRVSSALMDNGRTIDRGFEHFMIKTVNKNSITPDRKVEGCRIDFYYGIGAESRWKHHVTSISFILLPVQLHNQHHPIQVKEDIHIISCCSTLFLLSQDWLFASMVLIEMSFHR